MRILLEIFEKANYFCKYLKSSFQLLTSFNILSPHISGGKQKASNKSETLKLWRRKISSQMPEEIFSSWIIHNYWKHHFRSERSSWRASDSRPLHPYRINFSFSLVNPFIHVRERRDPTCQISPQKFWVKSELTPVFLSKKLSLEP